MFRIPFLLLLSASLTHGLDWVAAPIATSPDAGGRCAVAVDAAGRIHTAHTTVTGGTTTLVYSMRANRMSGFSAVRTFMATPQTVAHLDLDVGPDYTVQAAVVLSSADVVVFERTSTGAFATHTVSAAGASTASTGGVSIVAAGNGFSFPSLAFTAADGSAKFAEKIGLWSVPVAVTAGANSGWAPSLTDTYGGALAPTTTPRAIFTYNDALDRIQVSYYSLISSSWQAAQNVAPCPSSSRPSADVHLGKLGVAYTVTDGSGETLVREIRYAENAGGTWVVQTATTANEMESDLDFFSTNLEMEFDAAGQPLVGYKRDVFLSSTRDVRFRRRVPALGWELSVVETLGSGICSDLDLATNGAGDPALVFENDSGATNSAFTFARPAAQPFTVNTPAALDASYAHTFAPALARNLRGEMLLMASVATQEDIFSGRVYLRPKLMAYRSSPPVVSDIVTSNGPHFANALAVAPKGSIYFATLRGNTTSDTTGKLFYGRNTGGATASATGVAIISGGSYLELDAKRAPLRLVSDPNERLYLAFLATDGSATLLTRSPPPPPPGFDTIYRQWDALDAVPGAPAGLDLAVRPDGGYALSYVDTTERIVKLRTNVDTTGNLLATPTTRHFLTLAGGDPLPANTACLFSPGGAPRIVVCHNGVLKYLRSDGASVSVHQFATDCPEATVRAVIAGTRVDVAAHSTRDGGSLHHFRFHDIAPTAPLMSGRFAMPRTGLGGVGPDIALALDKDGMPVVASSQLSGGFPLFIFYDDILVSRPADALDEDGDGAPLLSENAHAMARHLPDAALLPAMETRTYNSGGVQVEMGTRFRHPKVPLSSGGPNGSNTFGEFRYELHYTEKLIDWSTPPAGLTQTSATDPDPQVNVGKRLVALVAGPAYRASRPRGFVRFEVSRDR